MKRIILAFVMLVGAECGLWAGQTSAPAVLTLAEAQNIALRNHPQIAAADYRALAAREVLTETRAGYYPNANLYGDAVGANSEDARILAGGLNNPSVYNHLAGGLSVSQLITDFGRTDNLTSSSKFQLEAENQNVNATREQVLLQVNLNYLGTLQARAVLQVAQQTLDTRQLLLDQVSLLASNKLKSELDVSFAGVAVQQGKLLVEKAQNDADAAMASLSAALGYAGPQQFQLSDPNPSTNSMPADDSQLVQIALAQRPELLSFRDQGIAAMKFARSQHDARLPSVSAFGEAGGSPAHDYHLPDDYAVGGIQISFPLFAGGLYKARQHEAEFKAQAEEELVRSLEDDIVRDVHIAWLNVNNAREEIKTTEELVRSASEAYDLAESRYKTGISSIVELSQAQLNLTSAQITNSNARYNLLIQQANLDYQVGSLH
jgi:outer membrane protein